MRKYQKVVTGQFNRRPVALEEGGRGGANIELFCQCVKPKHFHLTVMWI